MAYEASRIAVGPPAGSFSPHAKPVGTDADCGRQSGRETPDSSARLPGGRRRSARHPWVTGALLRCRFAARTASVCPARSRGSAGSQVPTQQKSWDAFMPEQQRVGRCEGGGEEVHSTSWACSEATVHD